MGKEKVLTEKEAALLEVLLAKEDLTLARQHFDYAIPDYIDIAIDVLNMAEMRYNLANKKLHKLCEDGKDLPKRETIISVY